MDEGPSHHGIAFSVQQAGIGLWKWAIHPPQSVQGLRALSGELAGDRDDAIAAAKRAIEAQDIYSVN